MLRIIGGEYKSRRLATPPDSAVTRPYTGLAREAVFNLLRGWFDGTTVLDLFAGVGSMGLEAVSRGAGHVFMVEASRSMFRLLEENIRTLGCSDRATAIMSDALSEGLFSRVSRPVDVIFVDPPYEMMAKELPRQRVMRQMGRLRDLMGDSGFLVLRSPVDPNRVPLILDAYAGPEVRQYGKSMWVLVYTPKAAVAD